MSFIFFFFTSLGSLFTDATATWNINKIDNLLNLMDPIPGVNKAYLYFGMWKASFAWHVEVNY